MVGDLILQKEEAKKLDIIPVFEAYERISGLFDLAPGLLDIYGHYCMIMEGRQAEWQASFYPDDFYDGRPGSKAVRIVPDAMGSHTFDPMTLADMQEVLERFYMSYTHRGIARNAPVLEVW